MGGVKLDYGEKGLVVFVCILNEFECCIDDDMWIFIFGFCGNIFMV